MKTILNVDLKSLLCFKKVAEIEHMTKAAQRGFTVPLVIYQYIENCCLYNGIDRNELMFPLTTRAVQKQLALVCYYLGYEGISTHGFRKWYATEIYKKNGYDISLAQRRIAPPP